MSPFSSSGATQAQSPCLHGQAADSVNGSDGADFRVGQGRHSGFKARHGMADTPVHRSWMAMRQRCLNPNDRAWKNYGGRGISICERWSSFENFLADLGGKPEGYELERIDVNGNYEPGNCRWATIKEQANNRRTSLLITHRGRTRTLTQWAEELGLKMHTLYRRIVIRKMPLDEAMRPALMSARETGKLGAKVRWSRDGGGRA